MSPLRYFQSLRRRSFFPRRNSLSLWSYENRLSRHTRLRLEALEARVMLDTELANLLIGVERFNADPQYDGIDGSGYAIVIIDTGADLDHPFFDGRIVHQQNFFDPLDDADDDDPEGHGTLVASIAAGFHAGGGGLPDYSGVAPGADIIVLKTSHLVPNPGGGLRSAHNSEDIAEALEWVVAELEGTNQYNIAAVNLSIGTNQTFDVRPDNTVQDVQDQIRALNCTVNPTENCGTRMWDALQTIESRGALITAAGGNSWGTEGEEGITFPGADIFSVSTIGTWHDEDNTTERQSSPDWSCGIGACVTDNLKLADRLVSFMSREDVLLDVSAPGAFISGAGLGGTFSDTQTGVNAGSSFAAPHVAGVGVLARQMADLYGATFLGPLFRNNDDSVQMNVGFRTLLQGTGVQVIDDDPWDPNPANYSRPEDENAVDSVHNKLSLFPRINLVRDATPDPYPTLAEIQTHNPGLTIPFGAPELPARPVQPTGLANRLVPPRVKDVTIGSTSDSRTYSFSGNVGGGQQLRTLPVANPNKISIQFTERISAQRADVSLVSAVTGDSYSLVYIPFLPDIGFFFDENTLTLELEFDGTFPADQLQLTLSDDIRDVLNDSLLDPATGSPLAANRIDGDWLTLTSLLDVNGSTFPSGNNVAGGAFVFQFTVLPGDANRDNIVGIDDLNTVRNNFGLGTVIWVLGEMTGDGVVNSFDLNHVYNNFGTNFTVWPGGGAQAASSGSGTTMLTAAARREAFIVALAELYATDSKERRTEAQDLFWATLQADEIWGDVLDKIEAN